MFGKKTTALMVAGVLAAGSFLAPGFVRDMQFARAEQQVQVSRKQLENVEGLSSVFREVGKAVEPSVVKIDVHKTVKGNPHRLPFDDEMLKRFFDKENGNGGGGEQELPSAPDGGSGDFEQIGTGSGVIMEVDGSTVYILTNNHVAGDADEIVITLADGRQVRKGKTVGADAKTDLALVKVSTDHVIPAKWGDSQELQKGDFVLAFGSPFGYVGSMTHGIVSALNRDVGILRQQQGYENFIQVDAPINPGNSGGPLTNLKGEVVGINTAIASRSGGFQGIGFAIPSNQAKFVYQELKAHGKVTRGYLGVSIASVNDPRVTDVVRGWGYKEVNGVLIHEVMSGSPTEGKLKEGDIVTKIDGKEVRDAQQLRNMIAAMAPGTETNMTVWRDGKTQDVKVKLGEQPENMRLASKRGSGGGSEPADTSVGKIGLRLSDITDELAQRFNLGDRKTGALVTTVDPKSVGAKEGLRPGDVILKVDRKAVNSAAEAREAIEKSDLKKGFSVYVVTPEGSRFVPLKAED